MQFVLNGQTRGLLYRAGNGAQQLSECHWRFFFEKYPKMILAPLSWIGGNVTLTRWKP